MDAKTLAKKFHSLYELLAPKFGYETKTETRVNWDDLPESNRNLMVGVCQQILDDLHAEEKKDVCDACGNKLTESHVMTLCAGCYELVAL